jgi:hypothetical protein
MVRWLWRCAGFRFMSKPLRLVWFRLPDPNAPDIRSFLKIIPTELPTFHKAELVSKGKRVMVIDEFQRLARLEGLKGAEDQWVPMRPGNGTNVDRAFSAHSEGSSWQNSPGSPVIRTTVPKVRLEH